MKKNKKKLKPLTKDQLSLIQGFYLHESKILNKSNIQEAVYNKNGTYKEGYIDWLQRYVLSDIIEMNQKLEQIMKHNEKEIKDLEKVAIKKEDIKK